MRRPHRANQRLEFSIGPPIPRGGERRRHVIGAEWSVPAAFGRVDIRHQNREELLLRVESAAHWETDFSSGHCAKRVDKLVQQHFPGVVSRIGRHGSGHERKVVSRDRIPVVHIVVWWLTFPIAAFIAG